MRDANGKIRYDDNGSVMWKKFKMLGEDIKQKYQALTTDLNTRLKNLVNDMKAHPKRSAAVIGGTIGALALTALGITGVALLEKHYRQKHDFFNGYEKKYRIRITKKVDTEIFNGYDQVNKIEQC